MFGAKGVRVEGEATESRNMWLVSLFVGLLVGVLVAGGSIVFREHMAMECVEFVGEGRGLSDAEIARCLDHWGVPCWRTVSEIVHPARDC